MNKYDVVIGVEVHIELKTKTKCFSSAPNTFAAKPNSQVSAIDCGYPGTMPSLNKEVVVSAIKLAHALNMKIDSLLRFDRKNYFYPDLPKGYQITQFFHPIGTNGELEIFCEQKKFTISFERMHIEEDTAKQIHQSNFTLLDYNRAGIPLLELVTKPIFNNAQQVITYINVLRKILINLGISDAKMNEGTLRCDLNISLKSKDKKALGTKVEIKNLNSLNNIALAIEYEINRQKELLEKKEIIKSQTRRFDEKKHQTILMREKLTTIDYKYFPDPNIFPIQLEESWINDIIKSLPELPDKIADNLKKRFNLNINEINIFLENPSLRELFEKIVKDNNLPKESINYFLGPVLGYLNENNIKNIKDTKINPQYLSELITLVKEEKINDKQSNKILITIFNSNKNSPKELLKLWNIKILSDRKEISNMIVKIFDQNPHMVDEYFQNSFKANKFFMGQIMKITKGQVNPKLAQELINQLIIEYKK